ncbi:MAG TPA: ABC transporter permease subunit [Solirubrobacteraceae bacterium]|jgi:phosphate transport system permease protein|nr:ABC transporter permease subunit [Solirubrobacteraceae bacterium]
MAGAALSPGAPPAPVRPLRESTSSWPILDRVGYWLSWATGIGLCLIAAAIVLYMGIKGLSYLRLSLFVTSPAPSLHQTQSGGFSDPIIGTLTVTAIGTLIAAPLGVGLAVWFSEYGRPTWLARAIESALEMLAGVPSVVLAIFGLLIFAQGFLSFLSQRAATGGVLGQSFVNAGIVMSALALPLVFASTRESLAQLPDRTREASYALGKTRATTIRRVLLPSIRPGMASGIVLGMGRIIGDTAIITILLGATLKNEPVGGTPVLGALRGTGSTLTSYVFNNSPAGEGNSHEKAYAAAFVLLLLVLLLNALVTRLTEGGPMGRASGAQRLRMVLLQYLPWK